MLLATGFTGPEPAVFSTFAFNKTPVGTIAKGSGYLILHVPVYLQQAMLGVGKVLWNGLLQKVVMRLLNVLNICML
ncbi:MAG: hypothetical protein ACLR2G_11765 [Phascolarctobacterium faecium]